MSDHSQSLRIIIIQERHPQPANPFGFADTDNICLQKTAVTEFLQTPAIHLIRYTAPPLGMKGFGVTPQEILMLFLAIAKNCRSFWLQIGTFIRIMLILHCPNIFHGRGTFPVTTACPALSAQGLLYIGVPLNNHGHRFNK